MTITPPRQSGKSIALALHAASKAEARKRVLVVTRAQFERFRKHGIPADQMRIAEEIPKS
jgi:thymidine kinase